MILAENQYFGQNDRNASKWPKSPETVRYKNRYEMGGSLIPVWSPEHDISAISAGTVQNRIPLYIYIKENILSKLF